MRATYRTIVHPVAYVPCTLPIIHAQCGIGVEAVQGDLFWSNGLSPQNAATTNAKYYPGLNHLVRMLQHLCTELIKFSRENCLIDNNVQPNDSE